MFPGHVSASGKGLTRGRSCIGQALQGTQMPLLSDSYLINYRCRMSLREKVGARVSNEGK